MTDLANKIVTALFDQITADGGLLKDRAVKRVAEVLAANELPFNVMPSRMISARQWVEEFEPVPAGTKITYTPYDETITFPLPTDKRRSPRVD